MMKPTTWKEHGKSLMLDLELLTNNFQVPIPT